MDQDRTLTQDTCLTQPASFYRRAVLTMLFIVMWVGIVLFILLEDRPFGVQFSSVVINTAAVALYTFSRNRNSNQPFMLSCPIVREQLPRLIRRHLVFLTGLLIFQTAAFNVRPYLPAYWITPGSRDPSPFSFALWILCACITLAQVLSNRSLLESAHDLAKSDYDR